MFTFLPKREIAPGDVIRLGRDIPNAWMGETATVVATYPAYDKLEVAFDHVRTAVIYGSDENVHWERFEPSRTKPWRIA